jgi:hypothetical protein
MNRPMEDIDLAYCDNPQGELDETEQGGNEAEIEQGEEQGSVRCPNHWGGGATRCPRGGADLQIWQRKMWGDY